MNPLQELQDVIIGTALLTAYDSKCGNSVLNVNVGKGVLSKVVVQKDNLYMGLAEG